MIVFSAYIQADAVAGRMLQIGVSDPQSGMKAMRASLLPSLHLTERHWGLDVQLIKQAQAAGARVAEVDIRFGPRTEGKSKTGFVSTSLDLLQTAFRAAGQKDEKEEKSFFARPKSGQSRPSNSPNATQSRPSVRQKSGKSRLHHSSRSRQRV